MGIIAQARQENGSLRGLTGAGEPGLYTLLGGTGEQGSANEYTTMGGTGQTSSTAKLAKAYKDTRLAQVAAGLPPASGGSSGPGGGAVTQPGYGENLQAR